jgi:hypothetical protein
VSQVWSGLPRLACAQKFRLAPVGDIAKHNHRAQQVIGFADLRTGVFNRERLAVPGLELIRLANLHSTVDECRPGEQVVLRRRRTVDADLMQNGADRFANQFPGRPAGEPGRRAVDEGDRSLDVDAEDAVARRVEQQLAAASDAGHFVLGPFARRDVQADADEPGQLLLLIEHRRHVQRKPVAMALPMGAEHLDREDSAIEGPVRRLREGNSVSRIIGATHFFPDDMRAVSLYVLWRVKLLTCDRAGVTIVCEYD